MNYFLKKDYIEFSIDKISMLEKETFIATIIPDINSEFFPPFHLRSIRGSYRLLEERLYKYWNPLSSNKSDHFKGSVVQGGYYRIPRKELWNVNLFHTFIDADNDVFYENIVEKSPYFEQDIKGEKVIEGKDVFEYLSKNNISKYDSIYIYGFNVGQGDTILLITSSGNTYLIDTNVYGKKGVSKFVNEVKSILIKHGLNKDKLTGVMVTHKHLDHIRGLKNILDNRYFKIDNFIINLDYIHSTKSVYQMLESAKKEIPVWVNLNRPGIIKDGDTIICVKNPDSCTSNSKNTPDINDSSIGLCVRYKGNLAYLTGDLSTNIINKKFSCNRLNYHKSNSFLKVSHHGSYTGTDLSTTNLLNPSYAFVSVGTSKKYNHPDSAVINILQSNIRDLKISKKEKRTICYEFRGNQIIVR